MQNFERMFTLNADAMCLIDAEGAILRRNAATSRLVGATLDKASGNLRDFLSSDKKEALMRVLKQLNDDTVSGSIDGQLPEAEVWTSWQLTRLEDNLIMAVGRDVSSHHQTKEALAQKSQFLHSIIEAEPECVKLLTSSGELLDMNQAGLKMVGAESREDVIGANTYDLIDPEDRERFQDFNERVCNGEGGELSFKIVGLDGTRRSMETTAVPLPRIPCGELLHLAITRDVTNRLQLEEQLRQSQKMEAVGHLAGGVAHDFNNLLTAIIGPAELALLDVDSNSQVAHDLKQIKATAERAARLTQKLLTFSRQQVVQLEILSLSDIVMNTREMLVRLIGENYDLDLAIDTSVDPVEADRGHLEQVLLNLALNARDSIVSGGFIKIALREQVINADESKRLGCGTGPHAALSVTDNGTGISAENLTHIFDPFFTTKPAGSGTGLGLATCYGIISEMKGVIDVKSEVGKGTCFTVFIPTKAGAVKTHDPMAPMRPGNGEKILLVEDESIVRDAVGRLLNAAGYEVHQSPDAEEAIKASAQMNEIDLLITDLRLPGMSGIELADRLRETRPELPVVLMTGYVSDTAIKTADCR